MTLKSRKINIIRWCMYD